MKTEPAPQTIGEEATTSTLSLTPNLTLETVAEHFADWRSKKKRGERIPEQLWSEAIALLDRYGLSQVTRTLRLSGQDLNRRRGVAGSGQRRRRGSRAQSFVEVDAAMLAQRKQRADTPGRLELIRTDGLRLYIEPGDGLDALAVLERFMEAR